MKNRTRWLACSLLLLACAARADDADPSKLYELSTAGSTDKVKAGEKGKWVLSIQSKEGAHVSDEAPLKIELAGKNLKPEKEKLVRADALAKGPSPRFEVPFTAQAAGKGGVDAKITFFICTDKICSRQQKTVSLPVDVL